MAVPGPELLADPAGSPGLLRCQAPSLSRPGPAEAAVPAESSLADTCSSPSAARSPRGWPPAAPSGRSLTQVTLPTISPAAGWGGSERHTPDSWPDTPEDQLLTGEGGFSGLGPPLGACGPHVAGRAAAARRPRLDSAPSQEEAASPDTALIYMALADRLLDRIALGDTGTTLCSCSVKGKKHDGSLYVQRGPTLCTGAAEHPKIPTATCHPSGGVTAVPQDLAYAFSSSLFTLRAFQIYREAAKSSERAHACSHFARR